MEKVVQFRITEKQAWRSVRRGKCNGESVDDKMAFLADLFEKTDIPTLEVVVRRI